VPEQMGVRWRIALDSLGISNGNALAPENTERATPAYKCFSPDEPGAASGFFPRVECSASQVKSLKRYPLVEALTRYPPGQWG